MWYPPPLGEGLGAGFVTPENEIQDIMSYTNRFKYGVRLITHTKAAVTSSVIKL